MRPPSMLDLHIRLVPWYDLRVRGLSDGKTSGWVVYPLAGQVPSMGRVVVSVLQMCSGSGTGSSFIQIDESASASR